MVGPTTTSAPGNGYKAGMTTDGVHDTGDDDAPAPPQSDAERCPECGGTGERDGEQCPACEGTGNVMRGLGGG